MTISTRADAMDILEFFSTKKNIGCLHEEGINSELYNNLFSRGWLTFTNGKGKGLYLQTTPDGMQVLYALKASIGNVQIPVSGNIQELLVTKVGAN